MSSPRVYVWPVLDPEAICLQQTNGAEGGPLVINGTIATPISNGNPTNYVKFNNISRVVRITSFDTDNSGVMFTVTGTFLGGVVSQELAGADGSVDTAFVETTQYFDSVTSITTDAQATDVQVGSGSTGQTAWNLFDYNRSLSYTTVQVVSGGTINYSFGATLDDVNVVADPFIYDLTGDLTSQTASAIGATTAPFRYSTVTINSSDETGFLIETFLQSGIT